MHNFGSINYLFCLIKIYHVTYFDDIFYKNKKTIVSKNLENDYENPI